MSLSLVLALALLGGLVGLDVVSFPQAMISRPIVAATLGGALLGRPVDGMLMGVVLELLALETLPVGAAWYPEWASAAVVGGALFASRAVPQAGSLALAMLAAVITAWAGGWTMQSVRRLNGLWARRNLSSIDAGNAGTVLNLQVRGLLADFLRGALLTGIAVAIFQPAMIALLQRWHLSAGDSMAVAIGIATAVAASAAWRRSRAAPGAPWYLVGGLAIGLAALVLL
ncbi:MAG TPA: PTS sugar transporter subunit IIC [Gemmatimonadaceae bacterium]|jgi:PTS system mannose-specific IIC component|nr:PTS sugar transporter subunit IIC [Gemmatimonadaceae bacterium]